MIVPVTVFWSRDAEDAEVVLASYEATLEALLLGLTPPPGETLSIAVEVRPAPSTVTLVEWKDGSQVPPGVAARQEEFYRRLASERRN